MLTAGLMKDLIAQIAMPTRGFASALLCRDRSRERWALSGIRAGLLLGFLFLAAVGQAHAACTITTPPGNLAFGLINPNDTIAKTASTTMTLTCTPGNTVVITDNGGLHNSGTSKRMSNSLVGTEYLPYTMTYTPNNVRFNTIPGGIITIGGSIAVLDFSNAYVGDYADDIVITVNP